MKYIISLSIITFFHPSIFAQLAHKITNGLDLFYLGEPIKKLGTLIKCYENKTSGHYHTSDTSKPCQEYYYLPSDRDTILIGNLRFNSIFLSFNDNQKLTVGNFMRIYRYTDSMKFSTKEVLDDFTNLFKYLNSMFHNKGKLNKSISSYDKNSLYREYNWYENDEIFGLTIYHSDKEVGRQNSFNIVAIYFRKRE